MSLCAGLNENWTPGSRWEDDIKIVVQRNIFLRCELFESCHGCGLYHDLDLSSLMNILCQTFNNSPKLSSNGKRTAIAIRISAIRKNKRT